MTLQRRDFFKIAAAGSAVLVAGKATASTESTSADFNDNFGVLVDTVACIGCRKCEWACNDQNHLPTQELKAFEDKSVFARHRRPDKSAYTVVNQYPNPTEPDKKFAIKVQCMHCNAPACVSACIVGALEKQKEGPVTYDSWKCIGCRYCMVACPFQIPAYEYDNALDPVVRKCTFCYERITTEGKKPACVAICPNEALTFAKRGELIQLARERILGKPDKYEHHIYGEHEIGGTGWMYLAGAPFTTTELPTLTSEPIPPKTEKIQHAVFKGFVPPIALYGLLAIGMYTFNERKKKVAREEAHHES